MRTFILFRAAGSLFSSIGLADGILTQVDGELGTEGTRRSRPFASLEKARGEYDRLVRERLDAGFRELTTPAPPPSPTLRALEDALAADPDDVASHMAHADLLAEQDDAFGLARSDFIRAQLTDPAKNYHPPEACLRHWLGELAPFLIDQHEDLHPGPYAHLFYGNPGSYRHAFERGWLSSVTARYCNEAFARALAAAPAARLLRTLAIVDPLEERKGDGSGSRVVYLGQPGTAVLIGSPALANLRSLLLVSVPEAEALIRACPRLEDLTIRAAPVNWELLGSLPLPHLRALRIDFRGSCDLLALADNPSLGRLEGLSVRGGGEGQEDYPVRGVAELIQSPHLTALRRLALEGIPIGDAVAGPLVRSGVLARLEELSLAGTELDDRGAAALAGSPHLARLLHLDVSDNYLSGAAVATLKATVARLTTERQSEPGEEDFFLRTDGDWE